MPDPFVTLRLYISLPLFLYFYLQTQAQNEFLTFHNRRVFHPSPILPNTHATTTHDENPPILKTKAPSKFHSLKPQKQAHYYPADCSEAAHPDPTAADTKIQPRRRRRPKHQTRTRAP